MDELSGTPPAPAGPPAPRARAVPALRNLTRGTVLATEVRFARSPVARLVGLMGRAGMTPGSALVFEGVRAVHTHFMRFAIDVVFYDRSWTVVDTIPALRPWRFSPYRRHAAGVVELPAGTLAATGTVTGDALSLT